MAYKSTMITNETSLTAKIKNPRSDVIVATGEKFIEVEVEIYADGELAETKKFGFQIGTSVEQIQKEIQQTLSNIKFENENAVANAEAEKVEKLAQDTVNDLAGLEINEQ